MFYRFSEGLTRHSCQTAASWEAETTIAAVLTEAIESARSFTIVELKEESIYLLANKGVPANILTEARRDLEMMFSKESGLEKQIANWRVDRTVREILNAELSPDKDRIMAAVRSDSDFAAYLKTSASHAKTTVRLQREWS